MLDQAVQATEAPSNIVDAARSILESARSAGLTLRTLGGIAVFLHATESARLALARPMQDMDFVTSRRDARNLGPLFQTHGFEANARFNALHGASRLMFIDAAQDRHIDVFVEQFEMCHVVPMADRLTVDHETVPLAELLLTKLQIIHLNRKDIVDACSVLVSHSVGSGDEETVNAERVAELCAEDWGLHHTLEINLGRLREHLPEVPLSASERSVVDERITTLQRAIADQPKSRRWKLRARVGERRRWYEQPEEVDRSGLQFES